MKEITLNKSFDELEKVYFEKHNTWKIEEDILYSFGKKGLKDLIKDTNNNYIKDKIPYSYNLGTKLFKANLNELEKYFIEQMSYYFNGGEELQKTSDFLNKLKRFYKLNYEINNNKTFKNFDVNYVSILDVISMYIKIPNNLNRNIVCPIHKEKSGSFKLYKNTNSYYCFGCKSGGNAVNFVSEIENITPKEAYIKLAKLYSK